MLTVEWFAKQYQILHGSNELWVAYSGGIDSRVLLELAYQYAQKYPKVRVHAIHINHGLHKNSACWSQHCGAICKNLAIPLQIVAVNLKLTKGQSIEAIARHARLEVWQQVLPAGASLLLAHHAQDQAETILYRLCRGTGPTGLAGMAATQIFAQGKLLRPLLTVAKEAINAFAIEHNLTWVDDDSNLEVKFARNYLRHKVLPILEQRWPKVINNIVRAGVLTAELNNLAKVNSKQLLPKLTGTAPQTLSITKLLALPITECFTSLREWLAQANYQMPSQAQLVKIRQEVMLARNKTQPILKFTNYCIRRYRDDLYVLGVEQELQAKQFTVCLTNKQDIMLANGAKLKLLTRQGRGFSLPNLQATITVCLGSCGKKAKKIFQQHNIPPWQRWQYPLVFYQDSLIYIANLWTHPNFKVASNKLGITISIC